MMDLNVTGQPGSGLPGFDAPNIQKIVAVELTAQSRGNGVGIGLAELSTRHCVDRIDLGAVYSTAITATVRNTAGVELHP